VFRNAFYLVSISQELAAAGTFAHVTNISGNCERREAICAYICIMPELFRPDGCIAIISGTKRKFLHYCYGFAALK